jgi:hypothetical protein
MMFFLSWQESPDRAPAHFVRNHAKKIMPAILGIVWIDKSSTAQKYRLAKYESRECIAIAMHMVPAPHHRTSSDLYSRHFPSGIHVLSHWHCVELLDPVTLPALLVSYDLRSTRQ